MFGGDRRRADSQGQLRQDRAQLRHRRQRSLVVAREVSGFLIPLPEIPGEGGAECAVPRVGRRRCPEVARQQVPRDGEVPARIEHLFEA